MAIYRNYKRLFNLIGNDIRSNTLKTIDEFLTDNVGNLANNTGLILNYVKSRGVSGDTTIKSLISTNANFGILNDVLRLAGGLVRTDETTKTFNDRAIYTNENKTVLGQNDLSIFGYSQGTFSFTNLSKKGDDFYLEFPGDLYGESYRLTGTIRLNGDDDFYFIPLGLIEMEPDTYQQITFGQNNSSVSCIENSFSVRIELTHPMIHGCYLSDSGGTVTPTVIAEVELVPGNVFGLGDDDYFLGLVIGDGLTPTFGNIVIDQKIIIIRKKEQLGRKPPKFSNIVDSGELFPVV